MEGGSLAMSAGASLKIFGPIRSHKCILYLVLRFLWGKSEKNVIDILFEEESD
jgi:hypothetical protein